MAQQYAQKKKQAAQRKLAFAPESVRLRAHPCWETAGLASVPKQQLRHFGSHARGAVQLELAPGPAPSRRRKGIANRGAQPKTADVGSDRDDAHEQADALASAATVSRPRRAAAVEGARKRRMRECSPCELSDSVFLSLANCSLVPM